MHVLHILSMDHGMESRSCRRRVVLLVSALMILVRLVHRSRTTHWWGAPYMWRSSRAVVRKTATILWLVAREPDWGDRMSTIRRRGAVLRTVAVVAVEGTGVNEGWDLACRGWWSEH